jgi:ankyrin repeat protein
MELLLKSGTDITAVDENRRAALLVAAKNGYITVVRLLLEKGADINNAAHEFDGQTVLQTALKNEHLKIVNTLLISGANVNAAAAQYNGRTLLQTAAEKGHIEIVTKLLDFEANVNVDAAENFALYCKVSAPPCAGKFYGGKYFCNANLYTVNEINIHKFLELDERSS